MTRLLAERLPRGSVLGRGRLGAMVEEASRRLADLGARVAVRQSDLLELEVDEPADLLVSTATFHWILDHERLFARLHDALRPGGRLVAQCGGRGQHRAHAGARPARWPRSRPTPGTSPGCHRELVLRRRRRRPSARLEGAGFTGARAWLEGRSARFDDMEAGAEFLTTVVLRRHLDLAARGPARPRSRATWPPDAPGRTAASRSTTCG